MSISTPVALFIFKRPDLTQMVFEVIASAKPKKLLVVADGPRFAEEAEKCERTRAIIEKVNWDCEVLTNFSDTNLGCGIRIVSGLDWVFSQVEEAIILEDDCLPNRSFFDFCQTLIDYYRYDERIMTISGSNYYPSRFQSDYSYYFSKYPHTWGWASWRRAWKYYDWTIKSWPEFKQTGMMKFVCENPQEEQYWTDIFDRMLGGIPDIWDYMWTYACWSQGGLTVRPNVNLVSNIGFRSDATHTLDTFSYLPIAAVPTSDIGEIKHPPFLVRNREADAYDFDYTCAGKGLKENLTFKAKLRRRLSVVKSRIKSLILQR